MKTKIKVFDQVVELDLDKSQMNMFGGDDKKIQKPGSRGGKYWINDKGEVIYGTRPGPKKAEKEKKLFDDFRMIHPKIEKPSIAIHKPGDSPQKNMNPWEIKLKDFVLDDDVSSQDKPNKTDKPVQNTFKIGQYMKEKYSDYIYQLQYVDPNKVDYTEKHTSEKEIIGMDSTQKYIQWFKQGYEPMPITVVIHQDSKKMNSINRRRILAARAAGVTKIPAWVEVGKRKDIIKQAVEKGKNVPEDVLKDYPELKNIQTKPILPKAETKPAESKKQAGGDESTSKDISQKIKTHFSDGTIEKHAYSDNLWSKYNKPSDSWGRYTVLKFFDDKQSAVKAAKNAKMDKYRIEKYNNPYSIKQQYMVTEPYKLSPIIKTKREFYFVVGDEIVKTQSDMIKVDPGFFVFEKFPNMSFRPERDMDVDLFVEQNSKISENDRKKLTSMEKLNSARRMAGASAVGQILGNTGQKDKWDEIL